MNGVSNETPGNLICWNYLWYVAAALAVMVAAITIQNFWLLNFVHIFSSLLWTGIDLFMGFVLGPILRRVDISLRREVMRQLTPRTLFLMPTVSIVAGTTCPCSKMYLAWESGGRCSRLKLIHGPVSTSGTVRDRCEMNGNSGRRCV